MSSSMAKGQRIRLVAVDSTFAYGKEIPDEILEAWTLTATFAQAAARAAVKNMGAGASQETTQSDLPSDDIVSEAYFTALATQFTKLGWLITTSGLVKYSGTTKKVLPKQVVVDVLAQYIQPDDEQVIATVLDALTDGEPDPQVADFLEFWWRHAEQAEDHFHFGMGPLRVVSQQPTITLVYFAFSYSPSNQRPGKGWRRLFDREQLQVQARYLSMQLNLQAYLEQRDSLKIRLGAKAAEHIATADLDI